MVVFAKVYRVLLKETLSCSAAARTLVRPPARYHSTTDCRSEAVGYNGDRNMSKDAHHH